MLRCPPSRVNLTSSDIADFEQRLAARQSARLTKPKGTNVRLSPGPAHPTRLSVVPAEQNVGRKRAASSSSEATLHNEIDDGSDEQPSWTIPDDSKNAWVADTEDIYQPLKSTSTLYNEAARALERAIQHEQSRPTSSPRRQVDSFFSTQQLINDSTPESNHRPLAHAFDGATEAYVEQELVEVRLVRPSGQRNDETRAKLANDARSALQQQIEPPALSSARARRGHGRSRDILDLPSSHQANQSASRQSGISEAAPSVPELVLPTTEIISSAECPSLDPGAPVFVPRTRFGSATGSSAEAAYNVSLEPRSSRVDSTHSSSNLRIRSYSQQNVDISTHLRQPILRTVVATTTTRDNDGRLGNANQPRHRRRSRTTDQNSSLPILAPNLERYPLMRPPSDLSSQRRVSNFQGSAIGTENNLRLGQSQNRDPTTTTNHPQSHLQVRNVSSLHIDGITDRVAHSRSVSPAFSTSSRSTPNLLQHPPSIPQINARGSSLPCNRVASHTPSFNRIPSMVSAASGASVGNSVSRQSSREGLDAAAEFLRMRNSPLDHLTEKFSRLSGGRLRSVGRSWERSPRTRVSLLSGDPFRPESGGDTASGPNRYPVEPAPGVIDTQRIEQPESAEELVALSIALPPSSPLRSSSDAVPSTPPTWSVPTSPRSPLAECSSGKPFRSPDISIKRKPVASGPKTPKVVVYDDRKPPNTQPKTAADVNKSNRRAKTRSVTAIDQSPILVGRVITSSPPMVPERHAHRNTYPSSATSQDSSHAVISAATGSTNSMSMTTPGTNPARRRVREQRNNYQAENDLEVHAHDLEEDRRLWMRRREAGDLDVTPPREGRFERFLS